MPLAAIKKNILQHINDKSIINNVLSGEDVRVKGLSASLAPLFLMTVQEATSLPILFVLPERERAESLRDELSPFLGEDAVSFFPEGEEDEESPVIVNPRRAGEQMKAIYDLLEARSNILLTSTAGAFQSLPNPDLIRNEIIQLSLGNRWDLHTLLDKLIHFGYTREVMVERPGEISLRGGILDVFPLTGEEPHRIEFFGDEVDSIRTFDVGSQRSQKKSDSLALMPSPIAWIDRDASILKFMPDDTLVLWEDPELVEAELEKGSKLKSKKVINSEQREELFQHRPKLSIHTLTSPDQIVDMGGRPLRPLGRSADEIRENLASLCDTREKVFLFVEQSSHKKRVKDFLDLDDVPLSDLHIDVAPLHRGFDFPDTGFAVITENDLFGRRLSRGRKRTFPMGVPIRELSALNKGDFVVHVDHGIGRYMGLETITVQSISRECLAIRYQDRDKLFVPVDKMERVQKYSGRDGVEPNLGKLGSGKWERIKRKTKESIKKIARELIELYSARSSLPGYAFAPDTPWQYELEETFLYDETPDQDRAINEVKQDMEKSYPMDRLVCGDVGYGKTEVAVRAAFKAVADGKQVAILVPTTILAQQHYHTFQDRLSRLPVNIEMLSRFKGPKAQKKIVAKLHTGEVDIVIGTHRLLSKDVGFKDLGLLIIDEEQRFGVRHKERLKAFRQTVDVMALSATPIPRTLQFSLLGIRDMSLITTPPKDRLPIITEVAPFKESIIVEAIEHEMARGGQIFFVHNRIHSIHAVARMIRRLVPGIRLAVAHGRMEEKELERVMNEFVEDKYDCLVATMIIESGLDMPNVNTLIVHRADRLGLAQLYQLRGRVGRSEKRAFAYLLTPPFHLLTPEAIKRLRTIEEFTELGAGFQIAVRDLEIRGAGNLLGMQQSGNMDAVGFDLYNRLVSEAVHEIKAETDESMEPSPPMVECRVDVNLSCLLPENYVSDESLRVNLYRRLSVAKEDAEIQNIAEELRDRFGKWPEEVENLLQVTQLRIQGESLGICRFIISEKTAEIYFDEAWFQEQETPELLSARLRSMIDSSPVPVRFLQGKEFGVRLTIQDEVPLPFIKKWLQRWG